MLSITRGSSSLDRSDAYRVARSELQFGFPLLITEREAGLSPRSFFARSRGAIPRKGDPSSELEKECGPAAGAHSSYSSTYIASISALNFAVQAFRFTLRVGVSSPVSCEKSLSRMVNRLIVS